MIPPAVFRVYDMEGKMVFETDVYGTKSRTWEWDGKDASGVYLPSGFYRYFFLSGPEMKPDFQNPDKKVLKERSGELVIMLGENAIVEFKVNKDIKEAKATGTVNAVYEDLEGSVNVTVINVDTEVMGVVKMGIDTEIGDNNKIYIGLWEKPEMIGKPIDGTVTTITGTSLSLIHI